MFEQRMIKCPFCEKGNIATSYTPQTVVMKRSRCSAKTAYSPFVKAAKEEVLTKECPNCGKTKKEIEERLRHGKSPSREDVIRRMREAGLDPTKMR